MTGVRPYACSLPCRPRCDPDSSECPEAICPAWWARLTVSIDDAGTLAHRWHVLTVDGWRRLRHACCAAIVHEAISHAKRQDVRLACERVIALCYRGVAGDYPSAGEWQKARADAASAASADASAADYAADASRQKSWDRMIDGFLNAMDRACTAAGS